MQESKYARSVSEPESHGFPSSSPWDEIVEFLRPRGQFMWFREIEGDRQDGIVFVKGQGEMLMLSGYSYLGLNRHPEIREASLKALTDFGTGTHGSRWLAGHTTLHMELKDLLAQIHGYDDAVVYSSGYVANVSTIAALLSRDDHVYSDRSNHASLIDGCRYSSAEFVRFRHNDPSHLRELLAKAPERGRRLVVIDGVFSMSGTLADVPEFARICKEYRAALMVDECHSHFVLGAHGGGVRDYFGMKHDDIAIEMGTLSKAIPANGGYVAASSDICTYLRRASRGFIYSGATSAVRIAAALAALRIIQRDGKMLLSKLNNNRKVFVKSLTEHGVRVPETPSPIVAVPVGPAVSAAMAATYCHRNNVFIHPVFPPVVEQGKSILRANVMANHRPEDLQRAAKIIADSVSRALSETSLSDATML